MTNDKNMPESPEHDGRDICQRSLSDSDSLSYRSKRPRYDQLPNMMQTVNESKKYHRLIEKKRRDRINECIYQLQELMPADIIKPNSKPMEKAVILELLVTYMQSINQNNKDGKSSEYIRGYKECNEKTLKFLSSAIGERQKKELKRHLQQEMTVTGKGNQVTVTTDVSLPPVKGVEDSMMDDQYISSSSLGMSSSMSDSSICADNSDSSGCRGMSTNKPPKRKVYSHHHHRSSNQGKRSSTSSSSSTPSPAPVFINMPFMMSPNVMPAPHFVSPGGAPITTNTASMPQLVPSFRATAPTGMMVPQMGSDTSGVQFPSFFMACGQQQRTKPQSHHQAPSSEPVMLQPTMMMPMRSQANFVFMPSYPMMPQFQAPTLVPMQTSTEEQTSPSE